MKKGLAVSPGIGIAKAFIINNPEIVIDESIIDKNGLATELERLKDAIANSGRQIKEILNLALDRGEKEKASIMEVHLMMLEDPMLAGRAADIISQKTVGAEYAISLAVKEQVAIFAEIEDQYIRERISDIEDIGLRILKNLLGLEIQDITALTEEVILIGNDIVPSQMAAADTKLVKGIVTETGGTTSHTAIMAKNAGIPAVMGVEGVVDLIREGQLIAIDGTAGTVEIEPPVGRLQYLQEKMARAEKLQIELQALRDVPSLTQDGKVIKLECNVEGSEGIKSAPAVGAEGIGLYRTEFLFMDRNTPPGEEEQFKAYKEAAEKMAGLPVTIRTLDIGGDKKIGYLGLAEEDNPFLGLRAIRLCFDHVDIFKTQLRAILRASAYGKIKIMFPMIATLAELVKAKEILADVKKDLTAENIDYDEDIEVGIMIEIPSAVVIADRLAKEADFFSIGTNDLIQYTLAVDRTNERVSYLYQAFDPAVIRLIGATVKAGHKEGIKVAMCGELAGNPKATLLLLGLGLDELSMNPPMVLRLRKIVQSVKKSKGENIANEVATMDDAQQIEGYLLQQYKELGLDYLLEL